MAQTILILTLAATIITGTLGKLSCHKVWKSWNRSQAGQCSIDNANYHNDHRRDGEKLKSTETC